MEELIKRVQEQLDNNWAVDAKDIQRLVNYNIMEKDMVHNIGGNWVNENELKELPIFSGEFKYYTTKRGNYIGCRKTWCGDTPFFHITEDSNPEKFYLISNYLHMNPEDKL